jgi:DNA-directed RNA polymerase subunit RPC12/RpoP
MNDEQIRCPKCGSSQIHSDKKGFSTGKAIAGTVAGGVVVGALAGTIGSNKIEFTCLKCENKFKIGESYAGTLKTEANKELSKMYVGAEANKTYKCHHCGRTASSKNYCPSCGCRYNETDLYVYEKPSKKRYLGVAFTLIGLCCLIFFLGILKRYL